MAMPAHHGAVAVYPIGVVQRLTGLSARQIRYYEKEGLLRPSRTRGNRRLYSAADVERLRQIKALLEQGLNLEGVRAYLAAGPQQQAELALTPPVPADTPAAGPAPAAPPAPPTPAARPPAVHPEAPPPSMMAEADGPGHHPAIFRQARGRRLSSLFPVDQQAELVHLLQLRREPPEAP